MASMNPKKGEGHPWWATAEAVLAAYTIGDTETIAAMEQAYADAIR